MSLFRLMKVEWSDGEFERVLAQIRAEIVRRVSPHAILLFGSAARNEMNNESDFDVAIIFDSVEKAELAGRIIFHQGPLCAWKVDVICWDRETFIIQREFGGIYSQVWNEGRVLFPLHFSKEQL